MPARSASPCPIRREATQWVLWPMGGDSAFKSPRTQLPQDPTRPGSAINGAIADCSLTVDLPEQRPREASEGTAACGHRLEPHEEGRSGATLQLL